MRRSSRLSIKRTNYTSDGTSDEDEPKKSKSEKPKMNNKSKVLLRKKPDQRKIDTPENLTKITSQPQANNTEKLSNKKSKNNEQSDGSSSESDIENYLQPADQIDLNSTFFTKLEEKKSFEAVENSIFAGVNRLSDSESDAEFVEKKTVKSKQRKTNIKNPKPIPIINFQHVQDYATKLEEAKMVVAKYEANKKQITSNEELKSETHDISNLLALGETKLDSSTEPHTSIHSSDYESLSESEKEDWEEVEEQENKETQKNLAIPKDDLQITVELPTVMRKKKGRDLVASMKRRLNRIRKENQVLVHKVHLLCWIGHGNYVNKILNNEGVLALVLSLIPTQYLNKSHQKLTNLEEVLKWYKNSMPNIEKRPSKDMTLYQLLKLQLIRKEIFNKKMLVYVFVCLLRSLGIQCRLVISFQVTPLRPPASELHSLSTKDSDKKSIKEENQLDGNDEIEANVKIEGDGEKNELKEETLSNKNTKKKKGTVKENKKTRNANKNSNLETVSDKVDEQKNVKIEINEPENKSDISKSRTAKPKESSAKNSKTNKQQSLNSKSEEVKPKTRSQSTKEEKSEINHFNTKPSTRSKSTSLLNPKENNNSPIKKRTSLSLRTNKNNISKIPQIDGADDTDSEEEKPLKKKRNNSAKSSKNHSKRVKSLPDYTEENSEDDFKPERPKRSAKNNTQTKLKSNTKPKGKSTARKSRGSQNESDEDSDYTPSKKKKDDSDDEFYESKARTKQRVRSKKDVDVELKSVKGFDIWVEVYLEAEKQWISVDVVKGEVHCTNQLHKRASHPITYIVAWNNDNSIKDITQRYCPDWNTTTRKLRIDKKWWDETIKPFEGQKTTRDQKEDEELAQIQLEKPLPTTINAYKNHPLYVLKRHLLKFEALYPPEPITLGFVRKEAVYSRDCVHRLRTREVWFKQAKVVKPGEEPYRILKTLKWDKIKREILRDQPLEVFGAWQVEDYVPPTAQNGIVPRNEYGNVDLFQTCMIPKGTVHLQLPGLNKLARRMNIDCAPAMVGFDFHSGWNHPVFDGYVVCEEYSESLIAAWYLEQEEQEKREQEKLEKRVYGNWKKLIKGLFIRERLKARYDFGVPTQSETGTKKRKTKGPKFVSKKRRHCSENESDSDSD